MYWTSFDSPIESLAIDELEVSQIGLWTREQLSARLVEEPQSFAPWFRLLCTEHFLKIPWTDAFLSSYTLSPDILELCRYKGPLT